MKAALDNEEAELVLLLLDIALRYVLPALNLLFTATKSTEALGSLFHTRKQLSALYNKLQAAKAYSRES